MPKMGLQEAVNVARDGGVDVGELLQAARTLADVVDPLKSGISSDHCPTCKRKFSTSTPKLRVCAACEKPITRHHKYRFRDDGRIEHRHCDNPEAYLPR